MIEFVQTGEYRTHSLTIKRFVNGVETPGDGFPITESLLSAFDFEPEVTENQLIDLTPVQFDLRVDAFKTYLLNKYSWLSPTDFINNAGGTDNVTCVPGTIVGTGSIAITQETDIVIFFDSSGSMNATLSPLLEMRNTLLKNALLPFYGMDEVKYNTKVNVISDPTERTFRMLNNREEGFPNPTLVMVFSDEANGVYQTDTSIVPRKPLFETDMAALRASLASFPPNYYRGIVFQVSKISSEGVQFKALMQAVKNGSVDYPLPYNLSDRSEIGFQFDVANGQNAQYYLDIIVLKMRELGYRL